MIIDVITLFPQMFQGFLMESIIHRAQKAKLVRINLHNLRDYTLNKHRKVDDRPYGGGPGMVLSPEPIFRAVEHLEKNKRRSHKILLTPQGKRFTQTKAKKLSQEKRLILLCGHYEGFDERVRQGFDWDEISIGDYVLTGGELPAMVVLDAIIRLRPGVLGNPTSLKDESFSIKGKQLDYPQYTRPPKFRELTVPDVLLSGHHQAISKWRQKQSRKRTRKQ
ncbi:MAG: tRNA (guanosine(37)-N1)-methyltransferase TrmD [Planctomycetes bacterium]|nr:tRNA (guanosine(37)-N1)-methyltransferase TrmD [Planctomycetota bacterium]